MNFLYSHKIFYDDSRNASIADPSIFIGLHPVNDAY